MNSEKVKEIKKGLSKEEIKEILKKRIENINSWETHALEYHKGLLDLINDFESENERLTEEKDLYKNQFNELEPRFFDLREENRQLKDRIAELEKQMCRNEDLHTATEKLNDMIILKQFAERLKEKTRVIVSYYADHADKSFNGISEKEIDETLKEFLK